MNAVVGLATYFLGLLVANLGAFGLAGGDGILLVTGGACMLSALAGLIARGGPKDGD